MALLRKALAYGAGVLPHRAESIPSVPYFASTHVDELPSQLRVHRQMDPPRLKDKLVPPFKERGPTTVRHTDVIAI